MATAKPLMLPPGREAAILVTHSAAGTLKPHVGRLLQALADQDIAVLLVVAADRAVAIPDEVLGRAAGVLVRENRGHDFAAWAHALALHPELQGAPTLHIVNDSLFGPPAGDAFPALIARVRASPADLVALTESHEHGWHVQSFFLALRPRLLGSRAWLAFVEGIRILPDKDAVIRAYEVPFASRMAAAGLSIELLFPGHGARNPVLFAWKALIAAGFPFVKLLLLRGAFAEADLTGWRGTLETAGFDLALLDATLAAASADPPPAPPGTALLARPRPVAPPVGSALKVAFYGPWNYDNGLGAASRGMVAALRRTGARLALEPVALPFHVHRPIVPPVPVRDFAGPADVAIVHLNPDSWHLLTAAQRGDIAAAGRRIGYWVWEMAHIPPAWRHEFSSVDRIWAPSRYCAGLFARQGEAPVDVIPHVVAVPPPAAPAEAARAATLAGLGIDPARRTILYVFDGSSYLVRKNPAALLRGFVAAALGGAGWTLVLKTKHLHDRPAEGAALAALAAATPHAVLIDRAMSGDALASLIAAADLYASTHCSEGFGLTIAQAMATGKPVIATDHGGSRDWLDADCGYPVAALPWRLDEDHGHYTKGGDWARIDEAALADTLRVAAAAVERGDRAIGAAARARVAERLSAEHVAGLVTASLAATVAAPPADTGRIVSALARGTRFDRAQLGPHVRAVPLGADGLPQPPFALAEVPAARDLWLAFAPADGVIAPDFARIVADHARTRPDVDILYADDVAIGEEDARAQLRLKPEFDATLLAAQDYVGCPVIVRAAAFHALGGLDGTLGPLALEQLLFRAHAAGRSIARIPAVLLGTAGARPRPDPAARAAKLRALPTFAGHDILDGRAPGALRLQRRFDPATMPPVTILVPTRRSPLPDGSGDCLSRLLDGLATTDWPMERLTVLVGDDIATPPDWLAPPRPYAIGRIATPRDDAAPFNYSAKMNRLWRAAPDEHLVLMNDDVAVRDPGWLKALMSFAVDAGVGGVGARLLYPDGRLQHAGIAPLFGLVAHAWIGCDADAATYRDWGSVHREWSMVTGAVFATRRAALEEVGGFDPRLTLEYNDLDLCLRLRAAGYRIVFTPHAEFDHVEKASRGEALPPPAETALFAARWRPFLAVDPAWHPGLRRDRFDVRPEDDPAAWYR